MNEIDRKKLFDLLRELLSQEAWDITGESYASFDENIEYLIRGIEKKFKVRLRKKQ